MRATVSQSPKDDLSSVKRDSSYPYLMYLHSKTPTVAFGNVHHSSAEFSSVRTAFAARPSAAALHPMESTARSGRRVGESAARWIKGANREAASAPTS